MQVAVCLATFAALIAGSLAMHWPARSFEPPTINIRWAPAVTMEQRAAAEHELGLTEAQLVEDRTWRYVPSRTGAGSLERIVRDPRVEDTANIDRARFRLLASHTRFEVFREDLEQAFENVHGNPRVWVVTLVTALAAASLIPAMQTLTGVARLRASPVARPAFIWYRVLVGLLTAFAVSSSPFLIYGPRPPEMQRNASWFADWPIFHWLAADVTRLTPIYWAAIGGALIFAIGVRARLALAVTTVAATLLVLTKLRVDSAHDWGLPLLILWSLVVIPWHRAMTQDEDGARLRAYAVWLPGFMLGVGFLAAATTKLVASGIDWITTGAVRYHFVQDAGSRLTDWSLWLASHERAAIAASALAIVAEASIIVFALARRPLLRLAGGLLVLMLLIGFNYLQGVLWPAWWIWLVSFLPWQGVQASVPRVVLPAAGRRVLAAIVVVIAVATLANVEIEPFIPNFPMYSSTFASPDAFNVQYRRDHRQVRVFRRAAAGCADDLTRALPDARVRLSAAVPPDPVSVAAMIRVDPVPRPEELAIQDSTRHFDFVHGRFVDEVRTLIAENGQWREAPVAVLPCDR